MTSPIQDKEPTASLALVRAASRGDLQVVEDLLAAGADVNWANDGGQTALMLAAVMGHVAVVAHLIQAGADPQLRDHLNLTALEWSTRRGFSEVTELLTKISPPLRPVRSDKKAELARTDTDKKTSDSISSDSELAKPDLVSSAVNTSTTTLATETAVGLQAPGPQPELRETSSPETISPPVEIATESAVPPTIATSALRAAAAKEDEELLKSSEFESSSETTTAPARQSGEPVVAAATPGVGLQTADPNPTAATLPASEPILLDEEDDTLRQPSSALPLDVSLANTFGAAALPEKRAASEPEFHTPAPRSRSAFSGSALSLSTISGGADSADTSNKRCPKCDTLYQNTSLLFCNRDYTALVASETIPPSASTLVAASDPVAASGTSSTPFAVWVLIALVLGASAFAAYRLTQYLFRTEAPSPIAANPAAPPVVEKPFFSVAGALAGMETNVPKPEYPLDLQNAAVAGPITVKIRVNKSGRVISAVSTSGDQRLRSAAVKAAKQATFAPDKIAEVSPRGRAVTGSITYEFAAPQTNGTILPTTTSTAEGNAASPATTAPNPDPNIPVVGTELVNAASNVPAADYPSRARRAGIGGTITVTIRVNRAGKVTSWRSSTGNSQLRAAAIKAARRTTFSPEKLPGSGDVLGTITYNFTP